MVKGGNEKLGFYTELVFITVFSLVAANLWTGLVYKVRDKYLGKSLTNDFFLTVIFTAFAVYGLYYAFALKKSIPPSLGDIHTGVAQYR